MPDKRGVPGLDVEFPNRLRFMRDGRGWSQRELAERAGISMQTVTLLEKGLITKEWNGEPPRLYNAPNPETLLRLSHALGVGPRYLAYGDASSEMAYPNSPSAAKRVVAQMRALRKDMSALRKQADALSARIEAAWKEILGIGNESDEDEDETLDS